MRPFPLTRRQLIGGGLLLAGGYALAFGAGHWPVARIPSSFLGAGPKSTLKAAFEVLLPATDQLDSMVDGVDDFLAQGDPVLGGQLRLALQVLEHLGGASPISFRRFTRLSVEDRAVVLERWRGSGVGTKRQIADAIRKVAVFTYYSLPEVWPDIGYDGPWVGR